VEFVGRLAGQDIARIGMISEKGAFIHTPVQDGAAGASEVQKVELSTSGAGSFTIGVKVGSATYTSTGIEYGANAATVRYALNAALGSAGSVQVASSVKGSYVITFEGALKGKNLEPVVVTLADAQAGPAGSFKLTLGNESTRSISYTADGAALAKRVQAELARLGGVGFHHSVDRAAYGVDVIAYEEQGVIELGFEVGDMRLHEAQSSQEFVLPHKTFERDALGKHAAVGLGCLEGGVGKSSGARSQF
jgi:hypothetical protein